MTEDLTLTLRDDDSEEVASFLPGEVMHVTARWRLPEEAHDVELRLVWSTSGAGDRDVEVVERWPLGSGLHGDRDLRVRLPEAPYSFSGRLVSIAWSFELVIDDGDHSRRADFVLAPGRTEVRAPVRSDDGAEETGG